MFSQWRRHCQMNSEQGEPLSHQSGNLYGCRSSEQYVPGPSQFLEYGRCTSNAYLHHRIGLAVLLSVETCVKSTASAGLPLRAEDTASAMQRNTRSVQRFGFYTRLETSGNGVCVVVHLACSLHICSPDQRMRSGNSRDHQTLCTYTDIQRNERLTPQTHRQSEVRAVSKDVCCAIEGHRLMASTMREQNGSYTWRRAIYKVDFYLFLEPPISPHELFCTHCSVYPLAHLRILLNVDLTQRLHIRDSLTYRGSRARRASTRSARAVYVARVHLKRY